jgi:hypothetical protein
MRGIGFAQSSSNLDDTIQKHGAHSLALAVGLHETDGDERGVYMMEGRAVLTLAKLVLELTLTLGVLLCTIR